ncbi:MAG: hypothetical protein U0840_17640 [Gemmataceae bacterium]
MTKGAAKVTKLIATNEVARAEEGCRCAGHAGAVGLWTTLELYFIKAAIPGRIRTLAAAAGARQ